jgi:ferredoxin
MPTIKFTNEKKEVQVPQGANLRHAAMGAGISVYNGINGFGAKVNEFANCHGLGLCGTCAVLITKGMENVHPMGVREKARMKISLHYVGHENTMRLSCQTQVNGDIEVETKPDLNLYGENFFS